MEPAGGQLHRLVDVLLVLWALAVVAAFAATHVELYRRAWTALF